MGWLDLYLVKRPISPANPEYQRLLVRLSPRSQAAIVPSFRIAAHWPPIGDRSLAGLSARKKVWINDGTGRPLSTRWAQGVRRHGWFTDGPFGRNGRDLWNRGVPGMLVVGNQKGPAAAVQK